MVHLVDRCPAPAKTARSRTFPEQQWLMLLVPFDVKHLRRFISDMDLGDDRSETFPNLLYQLHGAGDSAWAHDLAAAELMYYVHGRFAALARRHELDLWEAVSAAFDVMRAKSTRDTRDPWGVITHAVRIPCIYEERAQGLLCNVHQARRPHFSSFHNPDGFSTRALQIVDDHPVLAAIYQRYNRAEETEDTTTTVLVAFARAADRSDDLAAGAVEPRHREASPSTQACPRPLPQRISVLRGVQLPVTTRAPHEQAGHPIRLLLLQRQTHPQNQVHAPCNPRYRRRATRRKLLRPHLDQQGLVRRPRQEG